MRMILQLFRKKILKIVPIWLLLVIVIAGTALAAYNWISNPLTTTVNVTAFPATITGSFINTRTTYEYVRETFHYALNGGSTTGFIYLHFSGDIASQDDIQISTLMVQIAGPAFIMGEPKTTTYTPGGEQGEGDLTIIIGKQNGDPFTFDYSGGAITFYTQYCISTTGSINAELRLTSSAS